MPQLDKISFFSQFFYFVCFFFAFYFIFLRIFFPKLLKLFVVRKKMKFSVISLTSTGTASSAKFLNYKIGLNTVLKLYVTKLQNNVLTVHNFLLQVERTLIASTNARLLILVESQISLLFGNSTWLKQVIVRSNFRKARVKSIFSFFKLKLVLV